MPAPSSYARVLALLERLSPVWPSTATDKLVGKELGVIATALGHATDVLDTLMDETFPDTTDQLIARWEKVCRIPVRSADSLAVRRSRVLSVLRRTSGPRLEQLRGMLAGPFDLTEDEILFIEPARAQIEDVLRIELSNTYALTSASTPIRISRPWPGLVDSFGVKIEIECTGGPSAANEIAIIVQSPSGTQWNLGDIAANGFDGTRQSFRDASTFEGETAGGTWTIFASAPVGSCSIVFLSLLVSNDVDAASIYHFYAVRDADLAGDPDITEAQRLFQRTAHGHNKSLVAERLALVHGDDHSLHGREPHGAT